MDPRFFGDSHDMAKREIMRLLATDGKWLAHPMYFPEKPISSRDTDFVRSYESYLSVSVVGNYGIQGRRSLVADTKRINSDLFLDPDTGLWWAPSGRHPKHQVKIDELVNIVTSIERKDKLTLVFDQSKDHTSKSPDFLKQAKMKLACLRRNGVHAVAYTAHEGSGVRFILVSASCKAISLATRSMQSASGFPCWRFLDDGCGHVLGQKKEDLPRCPHHANQLHDLPPWRL